MSGKSEKILRSLEANTKQGKKWWKTLSPEDKSMYRKQYMEKVKEKALNPSVEPSHGSQPV